MNTRKNSLPILLICKSTLILLALILALMAVSTPGYAQPSAAEADFTAVDDYLESQRQALDIPGMAVSIVQGAQVAYLGSYGAADSDGRPVTPQTPFQIGSTTKSFTALAVMQLVETGLVELDAPIVPAAVALLWIGWSVFRFIRRSKRTPALRRSFMWWTFVLILSAAGLAVWGILRTILTLRQR
jgi:hypothetical protein